MRSTTSLPESRYMRKFKNSEFYSSTGTYYLLPFKFLRLNDSSEILVNEVGDFLIVPLGTAERIINRKINAIKDQDLYADLTANFFISSESLPLALRLNYKNFN
jgi:hypothetical protein